MMGQKSYLSVRQKGDLLLFLAGVGENYTKYIEWCNTNKVPEGNRFSEKYLHTWVQRRRPKFQNARADHNEDIRRMSMYDREKRISNLENDVNLINSHIMAAGSDHSIHQCTKCGFTHEQEGPGMVIKLLEQKRKLMQQIAQERNEWGNGKAEQASPEAPDRDRIKLSIMGLLSQATKTTIIEQT